MAEFVQKKVEDMRPVLEQMKKLELFSEHEIRYVLGYSCCASVFYIICHIYLL